MKELTDFYGSPFEAILQVSNCARAEVDKSYHLLSSSQALTYVLSKGLPDKFKKVKYNNHFTYADYLILQVEDDIKEIANESIRESVRESLYNSFKIGYLIYSYKNVPLQQQSRVRILCKMLWDKVIK